MGTETYDVINGIVCQNCGNEIDGGESGCPRYCPECEEEREEIARELVDDQ